MIRLQKRVVFDLGLLWFVGIHNKLLLLHANHWRYALDKCVVVGVLVHSNYDIFNGVKEIIEKKSLNSLKMAYCLFKYFTSCRKLIFLLDKRAALFYQY